MATVARANQPPIPADEEDQELYDEAGSVGEQNNVDIVTVFLSFLPL